jgi:DNA polymerase II small subunit
METLDQIKREVSKRGRRLTRDALDLLHSSASDRDLDSLLDIIVEKTDQVFITREDIEGILEEPSAVDLSVDNIPSALVFEPEAKGITSKVRILDDPGRDNQRGEGLEDYVSLFQDRYKKLAEVVSKRLGLPNLEGVTSGLQLRKDESSIVVGVVASKRIRKTGMWFDLEDPENKVSAFVSKRNGQTYGVARQIPLDSVVAARITRVRSSLNIVDELYLPDLDRGAPKRSQERVHAVLTSDLHVGSKVFLRHAFMRFVLWLNGKYGDDELRELASTVKYVVIAGDLIDGVGVYPYQEQEIEEINIRKQYEMAASLLEQIPDYIEIVILPGNHDATRKSLPQPPILKEYAESLYDRDSYHMVGNPVNVSLHGVKVYSFHGRSLDDCMSTMPGIRQSNNSEAMQMLLQARHIAPTFGLKTRIAPHRTDHLVIQTSPDIMHAGHIHVNSQSYYNNRLILNSGAWQAQTLYQREMGWEPTPGLVPIVDLSTLKMQLLDFRSA